MLAGFKAFRARSIAWSNKHPRSAKAVASAALVILLAMYHYAFVLVPLTIFEAGVRASAAASRSPDTALHLLPGVKLMWGGTVVILFALSAILAGMQKQVLSIFGRWLLVVWAGASGSLLVSAGWVLRDVAARLDVKLEDNGLVIGFLAAWVLVIGYLSKQPWDEARDRWAEEFCLDPSLKRRRANKK